MKRLLKVACFALVMSLGLNVQAQAQTRSEFKPAYIVNNAPYVALLSSNSTKIDWDKFTIPINMPTADDGYYKVDIGFPFEFNGDVYTSVYICVNGFITFNEPLNTVQRNPTNLFTDFSTFANNVIAPFWGDHYYRNILESLPGNGSYMPSEIRYSTDQVNGVFTVEWKNLNINHTGNAPVPSQNSSVGSFQVKIYKSPDLYNRQGDIEFCYGPVGGNPNTTNTTVITKNATVGLKGEFGEFINGLSYGTVPFTGWTSQNVTNAWPPSGATDRRIKFEAIRSFKVDDFWGDGDADYSKAQGQRHEGLPQNRYVSINDVRVIMKSVVTSIPLDSNRKRSAFHGDVNHNGRYFYNASAKRIDIKLPSNDYREDLNYYGVDSYKRVYFQANEADAAMIINFMSNRVPQLPWLYDTTLQNGKKEIRINEANSLTLGDLIPQNDNTTLLPIFINGTVDGPVSFKFDLNNNVEEIVYTKNIKDNAIIEFYNNKVVFAGAGLFNNQEPLFYVKMKSTNADVVLNNLTFNEQSLGTISLGNTTNVENNSIEVLSVKPNVFDDNTTVTLNVVTPAFFNVSVYDLMGNKVKELTNNELAVGSYTFNWNGTNNFNSQMPVGVYMIKMVSDNVNMTEKVVLSK